MKRTAKTILSISLLSILMSLTSCFSPIFYEVRKDVKPEKATVSGNIPNITRYRTADKEFLFLAADGGLRYKRADNEEHGSWSEYSVPFELTSFNFDDTAMNGQQIISVLANHDTLYVVSVDIATTGADGMSVPSTVHLWGKKISGTNGSVSGAGNWVHINAKLSSLLQIYYNREDGSVESGFNVFQTNAPMASHRHAYICSFDSTEKKFKYYELNGTDAPVEFTIEKAEDATAAANTDDGRVYSAAYYNGAVKFFHTETVSTDETYSKEAKTLYYTNGNDLWSMTGNSKVKIISADSKISTITTCADSIILGKGDIKAGAGGGGVSRLKITNGVLEHSFSDFSTNASFQLTDGYLVIAMINATPDKKEEDSALYASITYFNKNGVFDNIGLWSYYPGRGNWNRE